MSQHKLLYITSVDVHREGATLRPPTLALLSTLSRDFDISLAVVGSVSQTALNELRVTLGITRITGGFERGLDERPVSGALKAVFESSGLEPYVNGRLKAAIQRRAADFESVVLDSLEATPYMPLGIPGKTIYFAQEIASDADKIGRGFLGGRRVKRVKDMEFDALSRCDRVFSVPSTATAVLALGLPLGKLVDEATQPSAARPTISVAEFSATRMRIGYVGYLGDEQNVASLTWFLDNVWNAIRDAVPGLEFHVIGQDASDALEHKLTGYSDIVLHRDNRDTKLSELGLRVMIEPLLNETHTEAKLVNALARGIPVATTREGLSRARLDVGDAVSVADSSPHMVLNLRRLLSEATLWQALNERSQRIGSSLLPYHEVSHSMRRLLKRVES